MPTQQNAAYAPPDGTRPLGWAGFFFHAPEDFKLLQVVGGHARGKVRLVDTQQIRMEIVWATVTKTRFDAPTFIQRQMLRSLSNVPDKAQRARAATLAAAAEDPRMSAVSPALRVTDIEAGYDRIVGYCPATQRVFEIVYRLGNPAENLLVRNVCLRGFIDQPLDQPMKWAFFNTSFIAPPGFMYGTSKLNLGDMQVQLLKRGNDLTGPSLVIRQVYPAKLALMRQPIERWLLHWTRAHSPTWRIEGCGTSGKKPPVIYPRRVDVQSFVAGKAGAARQLDVLEARGKLRFLFRPFLWRAPKATRLWMWHDAEADRIIALHCSHSAQEVDATLEAAARGINWTGEATAGS